jgi:Ca-activated chloride channel family protein
VDANRSNAASLLADYFKFQSSEYSGGLRQEQVSRQHFFVLAALISLGLSRLLGFRRKRVSFAAEAARSPRSGKVAAGAGLLCVFLLLLSSCSQIQGHLLIMEGNFYHSRNRFAEAISSFLKAQSFNNAAPYAEYGLGLSYSALEEKDAALGRYSSAGESLDTIKGEHQELRYRLMYNTGIIHFEQGDYNKAVDFFHKALEIDGSRIEAKRNLELSLLALSSPNQSEPASSSTGTGTGEQGTQALFDYLRIKEQGQWKSQLTMETEPSGPDY